MIKNIYSRKTKYQNINLVKDGDYIKLLLNGSVQFVYPGENIYHQALIDEAIGFLGRHPTRVLILGGGDGLAARNVLRYKPRKVFQVEIDPLMITFARTHPFMSKLNRGSLNKVHIILDNALNVPKLKIGTFDLIVMDLTDPDRNSIKLYSPNYIHSLINKLKPGGVISAYGPSTLSFLAEAIPKSIYVRGMGNALIWYYKKSWN